MTLQELKTFNDFENVLPGEYLACEFHRNIGLKRIRFGVFKVALNRKDTNEMILNKKDNIYFNYKMFVDGDSNLKSAVLITPDPPNN